MVREVDVWHTVETGVDRESGALAVESQVLNQLFKQYEGQIDHSTREGISYALIPTFNFEHRKQAESVVGDDATEGQEVICGTAFFLKPITDVMGEDIGCFIACDPLKTGEPPIMLKINSQSGIVTNIDSPDSDMSDDDTRLFRSVIGGAESSLKSKQVSQRKLERQRKDYIRGRLALTATILAGVTVANGAAGWFRAAISRDYNGNYSDLISFMVEKGYQSPDQEKLDYDRNVDQKDITGVDTLLVGLDGCGPFDLVKYNFGKMKVYACQDANGHYTVHGSKPVQKR